MNVLLRGTLTERLPNQVRSRFFYIMPRKESISWSIHTDALMPSTDMYGMGAMVQVVFAHTGGTRTHKAQTPHMLLEVGFMMYSQKLLFSLRCPLELFGLYQSLVCRIYLGTCPWAPCRSRHPPRGRSVQRWLERMEKGKKVETVNTCQEERTVSCLSFGGNILIPSSSQRDLQTSKITSKEQTSRQPSQLAGDHPLLNEKEDLHTNSHKQ